MTTPQGSDSDRLERIERLVERIADDQAAMKADQAAMQADIASLSIDMGVIKGWQTELVVERRAREVFRLLCGGRLLRIYPDIGLQHYISHNRHTGSISRDEAIRAETIDFLLEGTDSGGAAVLYAVEVSYTGGIGDIDRAVDRADILSRVLGREVKPAVVSAAFTPQFEADAVSRNVSYVYIRNGSEIVR